MADDNELELVGVPTHLQCPISKTIFVDPITVPCCGRVFSRSSLEVVLVNNKICPICQTELNNFNIQTAPKSLNIQEALTDFLTENEGFIDEIELDRVKVKKELPMWKTILKKVPQTGVNLREIGKLTVFNTNPNFKIKSLMITVVDESGSMMGSPINQVRFSLDRVVDSAYQNKNVLCHVIGYDNTTQTFFIDTSQSKELNYEKVKKIGRSGGTSFTVAFDAIVKVMENMQNSPINNLSEITELVVVFMTDGEDSSLGHKDRIKLVGNLSKNIKAIWNKKFTVHTVGFGSSHDLEFLQKLTTAGTAQGVYRYADPKEDNDSLSAKIGSVINTIMSSSSTLIQLLPFKGQKTDKSGVENLDYSSPPVLGGENGTYWIDVTNISRSEETKFLYTVRSEGVPDQTVDICSQSELASFIGIGIEDKDEENVANEWYSYVMDQISSELYDLNLENINNKNIQSLDRTIHIELLNNRLKALSYKIKPDSDEYHRLTQILETFDTLKKGESVNVMTLADQKVEGRFKTEKTTKTVSQYTPSNFTTNNEVEVAKVERKMKVKRLDKTGLNEETKNILNIFFNANYKTCLDWLNSHSDDEIRNVQDATKSNLLILMSSVGRVKIIDELINRKIFTGKEKNSDGFTALDVCLVYGYWKSYDLLKNLEIVLNYPGVIFEDLIRDGYFNTAHRLLKQKLVVITDDLIHRSPVSCTQWLINNSNLDIDIESAVIKGAYAIVEEKAESYTGKLDWSKFDNILRKPSPEHVSIFKLLLEKNLLDPDQVYEIKNPSIDKTDNTDETEITWPLFVVCDRGNLQMFNILMNYVSSESIHRQNKNGCYCLWIASCNKHVDIVNRLLTEGADPNMVNSKGENSIVPACQKSAVTVVELLLVADARLDLYNVKRDNPFLLCCRTGQSVILEMFLQRFNSVELEDIHNRYAEIDGFNPLLASTELNHTECIKVCHNFGANLEWKTSDTNNIIKGATAVHLACFYNRLESLIVLLSLGADLFATTFEGNNCMHIAIKAGHLRIVGFLMSLPNKDELLLQRNNDNKKPQYYAQISGNEEIYQQYFCDRLGICLEKLLTAPKDVFDASSNKLLKYGETPGIYEFSNYVNNASGNRLLTLSLINKADNVSNLLTKMGVNYSSVDDYGIDANFWKAFCDGKNSTLTVQPHTQVMLDRIEQFRSKSMQNKLLLSVAKSPLKDTIPDDPSQSTKMNDGFNLTVDSNVLSTLEKSMSEQSLLGFIDKLKSNKLINKNLLESIIWESKVHLIKLIARGEEYLSPVQIMALYLYSSNVNILEQVNTSLTQWNQSILWHPLILTIYQALNNLPNYEGEVYRTVDHKFDPEFYKLDSVLTWSTFSICSKEYSACIDAIKLNKGIVFVIKSKTGKNISIYSKTPVDQDVIFAPGIKFKITNYYRADQIALAQSNIRNTTFRIRDKDIQNATNGECIIIELSEIND